MVNQKIRDIIKKVYYLYEDFIEKDLTCRNVILKDKYQGKRCILIGTGQQVNDIDFLKLRNEYTFACNFFHVHPQFSEMNVTFYALPPSLRVLNTKEKGHRPEDVFIPLDKDSKEYPLTLFLHASVNSYIEKYNILQEHDIYYVKPKGTLRSGIDLSNNLSKRMHFLDGAFFFMVAAAMYMGFSELYVLGCGYQYLPTQYAHFYDTDETLKKVASFGNVELDPKHNEMLKFINKHNVKIHLVVPEGYSSVIYPSIPQCDFEKKFNCQKKR